MYLTYRDCGYFHEGECHKDVTACGFPYLCCNRNDCPEIPATNADKIQKPTAIRTCKTCEHRFSIELKGNKNRQIHYCRLQPRPKNKNGYAVVTNSTEACDNYKKK